MGYEPGSNIRGLIAKADIPAETVIMNVPKSLIIEGGEDWCPSFESIKKEMGMGRQSKWFEYFEFDDSSGGRLPLDWDRSGSAVRELQGLIPDGTTHEDIDWFHAAGCIVGKEMTDLDFRAFKLCLTRSMYLGVAPMFDLMNHHNGKTNARLEDDDEGGFHVISLLDIPAGFPIYFSYGTAGSKSTNDFFVQYGFVEDYPQLWEWNDLDLDRIAQEKEDHAYDRYVTRGNYHDNNDEHPNHLRYWKNKMNFEPSSPYYQVLVISPTLAALYPTKHLTGVLGKGQLSLEEWRTEINNHHATLRSSYVDALHDLAMRDLNSWPTTIEEDEELIRNLRRGALNEFGGVFENVNDVAMAIEYRLAFKKALKLTMEVAKRDAFFRETDEL